MKTIGVIGNLGNDDSIGGQITKTRELLNAVLKHQETNNCASVELLKRKKRTKNVYILDVGKEKNPFVFCCKLYNLIRKSDLVIIILASKGYFFLLPLIMFLNAIYKKDIYEFVIGGIRYEYLNNKRIAYEKKIKMIYVESTFMVKKYQELGIYNVEYMPNFKRVHRIDDKEVEKRNETRIRVCTFSRIDKYKGIDTAIEIMNKITILDNSIFLDIFGPVDESYKDDFELLLRTSNKNIRYKGAIDNKDAVEYLKYYDILLFPTKWKAEGFPGSFIDAMAAGLVILASERENFRDIIENGVNGYLFDEDDVQAFVDKIMYFSQNKKALRMIQKNALDSSYMYNSEIVLKDFFDKIR